MKNNLSPVSKKRSRSSSSSSSRSSKRIKHSVKSHIDHKGRFELNRIKAQQRLAKKANNPLRSVNHKEDSVTNKLLSDFLRENAKRRNSK